MSKEEIIKGIMYFLIDINFKGDLQTIRDFIKDLDWSTLNEIYEDLADKKLEQVKE